MTHTTTRLHRCLVHALRSSRPDSPTRPITVAEIYQDLVPYRAVRSALGVELNADYEHALVRLLAGEGGHVRLEPPEASDELRRELRSSNPNVGLYRKFAACDVWVDLSLPAGEGPPDPGGTPGSEDAVRAVAAEAPAAGAALPGRQGAGPAPDLHGGAGAAASRGAGGTAAPRTGGTMAPRTGVPGGSPPESASCVFCRATLPESRAVRYCPSCGADQSQRPCPECGEVLEGAWNYCIACGTDVAQRGPATQR